MGTNHGGVNFGRRLPPIGGQYSTPINSLFRHLLALDAFGFAPELTRKVERLDSLLAAAAAGPGAGGYAVPAGLWDAGNARRRLTAGG